MPDSSIQQITTENAKSSSLNLQPDYNETKRMMVHGPEAVQIFDSADKVGCSQPLPLLWKLRHGSKSLTFPHKQTFTNLGPFEFLSDSGNGL